LSFYQNLNFKGGEESPVRELSYTRLKMLINEHHFSDLCFFCIHGETIDVQP
jgi:hypothetical protein